MYAHSRAEFDKFVASAAKVAEFRTRVEENSGCWKVIQSNVFPSSTLPYPCQKSRRWCPRWQGQGPVSQRRVTQLHDCRRGLHVGHQVDDVRVLVCGCFRWRRQTRWEDEGCVDDPSMISQAMLKRCVASHDWKTTLLMARGGGRCAGSLSVVSLSSPCVKRRRTWTALRNHLELRHFNNATEPSLRPSTECPKYPVSLGEWYFLDKHWLFSRSGSVSICSTLALIPFTSWSSDSSSTYSGALSTCWCLTLACVVPSTRGSPWCGSASASLLGTWGRLRQSCHLREH